MPFLLINGTVLLFDEWDSFTQCSSVSNTSTVLILQYDTWHFGQATCSFKSDSLRKEGAG